ncbi:hypothetical protein AGDE_05086 [Angomonas deanei]|uniref:JmjC domain, hydroxylase, putative n=1 Tax=Angomonas deanei TaxID=59799 RepID=S9V9N9_9TRYP|nr:hypothetical protein AGDE_06205 [Angomonas deanei]EPY38843.1 hypothetical protein AGDE_05086 [Angomonas deanei]CAD2215500.1 JmjC domain, hydroxylase, putative [Angomonas deanei]|eukprot:EPY37729.1 hypothetical protein AGDE_06205 [Angomonas deanei]
MIELDANTLTFTEFRDQCLIPNRPALIRNASGAHFPVAALEAALTPTALMRSLGTDHSLPVYHETCPGEVTCSQMTWSDLVKVWGSANEDPENGFYLKDWHAPCELGRLGEPLPYTAPPYLGADWLNAFYDHSNDRDGDYRFAYIGPAGTWTGFHADVIGSYSWSLNVSGDKLWYFLSPESNSYYGEHHVGDLNPCDMRVMSDVTYFKVTQHPGELIFVPSQYFHQVHNIRGEPFPLPSQEGNTVQLVISINHNWLNEFCIDRVVSLFLREMELLCKYYSMEDICLLCEGGDRESVERFVEGALLSGTNRNCHTMRSLLRFANDHFCCDEMAQMKDLKDYISAIDDRLSSLFVN